MVPTKFTWQQKLAALAGSPPRGQATRILRAIKPHLRGIVVKKRSVLNWINEGRAPHDLDAILGAVVRAYGDRGVTLEWLLDGKDTPLPIIGQGATAENVQGLIRVAKAAGFRPAAIEVLLAISDDGACDFLHRQLDVYRAVRASAPPSGSTRR